MIKHSLSGPFYLPRRLDANKLMCNCKLIWLIEMLKQASHQRHTQAAATCEYPRNLRTRNLMDISPEELNCSKSSPNNI